ncbi:peptidyl-prolyl cis-trans isomerase [Pseudomaricurvus alkylphenolicus]|jgi:parvulin-like peptidyl-prolyl isomerase|uniref:peptidylprolyl isomerase n=1 Tax=Pseudomaricurvus alkylphenolicus TaxID=1306991 RepID=UPI001424453B|nr:peptidylprolyl isomerase [Pseudomaricurvus alkylphenolicus]NIB44923.1 peptidyl-prolyl cis-trans isomerase [Pseudomaricurvus alkylphenolicus]
MSDTSDQTIRIPWYRDPLSHFLVAGLALFLGLSAISGDDSSERDIVVDRETLLTFVQYRTKVFQPELAAKRLDAMTVEQKANLVRQYVEEEALYREAIAMGLEGDDYVIRRRMVQKLEFITQGFVEQGVEVDEESLEAFFQQQRDDYFIEPSVTFTHVFLSAEKHPGGELQQSAEGMLKQLHEEKVNFSESMRFGDRFPFHVNYVERTPEFVASHFGQSFADEVFDLALPEQDGSRWVGPFSSQYGLHLVNVSQRLPGRYPELAEVVDVVKQDYRQAQIREKQRLAIEEIVQRYRVVER